MRSNGTQDDAPQNASSVVIVLHGQVQNQRMINMTENHVPVSLMGHAWVCLLCIFE